MQSFPMINGVLLDISGVLLDGDAVVPGAVVSVERLRFAGLPVRFLTNTTRQSKRKLVDQLRSCGIDAGVDEVFAPAAAACAFLAESGYAPHLLVHPALEEDFADCSRDGPTAVVIGDAGEAFTYQRMNSAFRALREGAPLLALARNRFFKDRDGGLSLDAGPFVEALEYAAGTRALLFGKPAAEFFVAAAGSMGSDLSATAMVGDDAESDVAGALSAAIGTGILVRTGKYRDGDENHVTPKPSLVVKDIGAASDFILQSRGS
jgi:HAD superfamily hydrolase (TIGR01458 family)